MKFGLSFAMNRSIASAKMRWQMRSEVHRLKLRVSLREVDDHHLAISETDDDGLLEGGFVRRRVLFAERVELR